MEEGAIYDQLEFPEMTHYTLVYCTNLSCLPISITTIDP